MTAYTLLMPGIPMLLQGQEFAASTPFLYFADHRTAVGQAVRDGRGEFLAQFPSLAGPEMQRRLADPSANETFRCCVLDFGERQSHAAVYALHRDLLALRRTDRVIARRPARIDGAIIGVHAWLLRFFADDADRLLIVNLGQEMTPAPLPEPLMAPLEGQAWQVLWSSEAPAYGGSGTPPLYRNGNLHIPGESALVLGPGPLAWEIAPELHSGAEDSPANG